MTGSVGILNVGAGDTKLSFDPSNPAERIRAARIVKDMLRRGYALLIEAGTDAAGKTVYQRALDFDEEKAEYIIADFDPEIAAEVDAADGESVPPGPATQERRKPGRTRRVDAGKTTGVAVARIAGG